MLDAHAGSEPVAAGSAADAAAQAPALVQVRGLKMYFPIYAGLLRRRVGDVKAVDGLSFVGNRLEKTRDYPAPEGQEEKLFMITDSDHVKVENPKRVSAKLTTSAN